MLIFLTKVAIFFFLLLSLTGAGCTFCPTPGQECSRPPTFKPTVNKQEARSVGYVSPTIFSVAQDIAHQLKSNIKGGQISDWPCIVTTFVDLDNLEQSTRFGRVLAESVGSELFRLGADIKDVRPARALYFQPGTGELILSRKAKRLASSVRARAVLVGTYTTGASSVIVTVRLIDLYNGKLLSVAGEEIAKTDSIKALLGTQPSPDQMEAEPTSYDTQPL